MAADQPNQKQGKSSTATTTGAMTSNTVTKRPKERVPTKPELTEINDVLKCLLCFGYLIDATAIMECHHTFCKSCILKFIEKTGFCPTCEIQLNTVKPHLSLRSDVIIQRLVYKLVPSLLVSELRRRKDHAEEKENIVKAAESVSDTMALEVDAASDLSTILSLDDVVSLSIEYFRGPSTPTDNDEANVSVNVKPKPASQKQEKLSASSAATNVYQTIEDVNCSTDANDRRYLKCPAAVSVGLLKKFIRMKYGLSDDYRVDLLYNGVRDNTGLESELTLLDVAFIYKWNKDEPMRFQYQIFDRTVKSLQTRAGSKRSASSMMDEPPDDDAASGPHNNNRPPMTSSSAPSSKIPRVSNNSSTTGANNNSSGRTGGSSRTTTSTVSHTHTMSPSTPVYDFSGNSDAEEPIQPMQHKGKPKLRGFRKESSNTSNTIASSSCSKSSQSSKRSPSSLHHKRSSPEGRRRSSGSGSGGGKSPARSNSVGTTGDSDDHSEDADSDSSSSDESDGAKTAELTNSRVRSAAQTVMASQVNGSIKLSMPSEKREPLKLSLGSVLAKSPEHKHKHKHHHKMKHKKKHKPLKISLSLNSASSNAGSGTTTATNTNRENVNQSQSNHNKPTGAGTGVKIEGKGPKMIFGLGQNKNMEGGKVGGNVPTGSTNSQSNFPVNVKPTTSAHLSNMSKSISVSIGVGNNSQKAVNNSNATTTVANQLAKKMLNSTTTTATTLVPNKKKNSGIEIQPTTQNANSSSNSNQSSARSHPLLPDSVHVPKSVTLIPVNPTGGGSSSIATTTTSIGGGRGVGNILSGNVSEKSGSANNSGSSTSNRLNAHTFTHPITNKSLHQITVTEVPPPPKSGGSSPASTSSGGSANNSGNNSNITSNAPSSCISSCPNPIEKVIANAANKPQFSGPGSMEITKIYCNSKENPTKKLKERKGLDISITVPAGMNIKNKTSKLEETLRQKMGLHNNTNSSSNTTNSTTMTMGNKIKGNNGSGSLFNVGSGSNAKMPPGITIGPIGPAGVNKQQQSISGSVSSTISGNTTIPGLGFTLPPHITAHPQHPTAVGVSAPKQLVVNQVMKQQQQHQHQAGDNKQLTGITSKGKNVQMGGGNKTKDLPISCIGSGSGGIPKGNQATKAYENRKQLGEALASMIDMANRNALKSPSPPKNSQQSSKDHHHQKTTGNTGIKLNQPAASCEKRALDMSSSSSRKNSRESPEPKRSKTNESSGLSTLKSSTNESPLDLSGTGRPNSRPNSNSSSPIHHHNMKTSHSPHHEKVLKHNEPLQSGGAGKKCPTPVPKVSPPNNANIATSTTPTGFPSPSGKSGGKVSTPTGSSPSILSIAQNLAQKQLNQQQQQQKEQFLHNQIMHLQQGLQNMHAANALSHSHNLQQTQQQTGKAGSGVSLLGNSLSPKGSHAPLNSLSPLPNPSPPSQTPSSFDPLRNLLTLSDAAVAARHGKVHPMNSLMAAVGMCPPSHGLSLPSPTSVTSANSLFPHLVNSLGGGKSVGGGMLDPGSAHAYLAQAISAHNERLAVAAGMGHFHGDSSMSPPMSLGGNSFFTQQVRPNNSPHGSLRIPSAPVSTSTISNKAGSGGSSNSGGHGKNNIKQQGSPPLSFSQHPTPPSIAAAPRSPNKALSTSTSTPTSSHSNKSHHHGSSISSNMKPSRINGTTPAFSGHLPIFPPGIHNPILPTYSRSMTTTSSTSSPNPISSSTSSSTNKVSGTDKKGIPQMMNISNFLPNKPKDGKGQPDNSHAEATITSGSNVGGGTSLTKFLNSIPPLIVSQQSNLSVSPSASTSTLPKEQALTSTTSKGLSAAINKSSNEQECRSKSKSSESKSTFPSSASSNLHNPIKIEPSEKKPSSIIPLKSTLTGPIICSTGTGSPPKSTDWKLGEEKATNKSHYSSSEIKSEGATTLMSSISPPKVGIFSLGSPPVSRTTTNQAVRHIPNPALLFNRQNSGNSGSSSTPSPITSPTNEYGKSLPFSQKSPLKLDETGLTLTAPSLPFPGVSVPVQVKVDNDAAPIPIPTPKPNPTLVEHQQLGSAQPSNIPQPNTKIPPKTSTAKVVTETDLLIAQPPNKEMEKTAKIQTLPSTATILHQETANQICKTEKIVKIEYTTEDADLDIDVGIETTPILFHSSKDNEVEPPTRTSVLNDDEKIEQNTPSTCPEVEVGVDETLSIPDKIDDILPSAVGAILSANEIKTENTPCPLDTTDEQDDTTKTQPSPSVTSEDDAKEELEIHSSTTPVLSAPTPIEESETIPDNMEETEAEKVSPSSVTDPHLPETGIESMLPEEKTRQVETVEEGVKEQVETGLDATTDPCPETPMEIVQQEDEELESQEGEKEEEKSGEIPVVAVEISSSREDDILTTESTHPADIPTNSNKSTELQIESMECEEASQLPPNMGCDEDHDMEPEVETDHEIVAMVMDDENDVAGLKENENLAQVQETVEAVIPSQTTENVQELPAVIEVQEAGAASEIQVVAQEQNSFLATIFPQEFTAPDTDQEVEDETSSNEDDLLSSTPTLVIHTSNSDSQIQTKDLKFEESSESNSIFNQITINPEALQAADTDIMTEPIATANDEPVGVEVEPSIDEEIFLADNNQSNNNTEATTLIKENEGDEKKLTESSSTSLLELNCPSAGTTITELSNPVTTAVSESEVHTTPEILGHVLPESTKDEELELNNFSENYEIVQTPELNTAIDVAAESNVEMEELLFQVGDNVKEICFTPVVPEMETGITTDGIEIPFETPAANVQFEFNSELIIPAPEQPSTFSFSLTETEDLDGDVNMSDEPLQIIPELQTPSPPVATFVLADDSTISSSPSLISATATITTTTAEISSNVMSSSMESSISSRNSLESPTSPEEDIKKMETLEQVAAGLFAANTMNNNNNKTINAPSCEIAITTTSANDMATV